MNADAQLMWIASAVDAMEDIRAAEVANVSAEVRRSITRPAQIVPEIARLVADKRKRPAYSEAKPESHEFRIDREAQLRRGAARSQAETEDAWKWERNARIEAGLYVPRIEPPLNAAEISKLSPAFVKLGLATGALVNDGGVLRDRNG